ncbi:50S ribosomal protein L18 [Patescibacteria group bacterium]|nr:50S ribosomal protein L18 [Patescibacteria group bacterium]
MNKQKEKLEKKNRRKYRIRARISGTVTVPRLRVSKSNKGLYAQLIDDEKGVTIFGMTTKKINKVGTKTEICFEVGKEIAKQAVAKEITKVVFDRGGDRYHGRVKAVAEGAREAGLVL